MMALDRSANFRHSGDKGEIIHINSVSDILRHKQLNSCHVAQSSRSWPTRRELSGDEAKQCRARCCMPSGPVPRTRLLLLLVTPLPSPCELARSRSCWWSRSGSFRGGALGRPRCRISATRHSCVWPSSSGRRGLAPRPRPSPSSGSRSPRLPTRSHPGSSRPETAFGMATRACGQAELVPRPSSRRSSTRHTHATSTRRARCGARAYSSYCEVLEP